MPRDERANVYAFVPPHNDGESGTDAGAAGSAGPDGDRVSEMKAVLSCLEYLYGEAVRVQARMSAHLIGAAAESMRREIAEADGPA